MKKALTKEIGKIYHYKDGVKVDGVHSDIHGDVSGIRGNIDDCQLTDEERKSGIEIKDIIA